MSCSQRQAAAHKRFYEPTLQASARDVMQQIIPWAGASVSHLSQQLDRFKTQCWTGTSRDGVQACESKADAQNTATAHRLSCESQRSQWLQGSLASRSVKPAVRYSNIAVLCNTAVAVAVAGSPDRKKKNAACSQWHFFNAFPVS